MDVGAAEQWRKIGVAQGEGMVVPLLGTVAAGAPLQAFAVEDVLTVPPGFWTGRKVFALRARGTSMVDEGIHDGDYLIVEPRETAHNGQTVVAEVDGGVTVKRFFREPSGRIRLQPANREMLPFVVTAERVRLIGVVVGVLRRHGFRSASRRPRPVPPPVLVADEATLDLALEAMARALRDAEEHAAASHGVDASRTRELARSLRALRDCYLETTTPRLRRALLDEASTLMRRLSGARARQRSTSNVQC